MQQTTYGDRDECLLQRLVKIAPTEADAFLQWSAALTREDGKRGKVAGRWHGDSRVHGRVCVSIFRGIPDAPAGR